MEDYKKNHETTIRLKRAWFNRNIDLRFFQKNHLKKCKKLLNQF